MSIFVDTSVWYSAMDSADRQNSRAKEILLEGEPLITSDHVLIETWFLTRRRLNKKAADSYWDRLRGGVASIEPVGTADLEVARSILESFADQDFSIVDCTSFAVMLRLGLTTAAAFDVHFSVFRFGQRKHKAFQVLN
ncbi:MAG: PIN domain-containing protein [Actinomycetota bacterium]